METWDIYDAKKHPTGRTMARNDWHMQPGEFHLTVLGAIRRPDGRYLITRRAPDKPYGAGMWEISGGAAKAGESSLDAVLREIREEVGLDVSGAAGRLLFTYKRCNPEEGDNYFVDVYRFEEDVSPEEVAVLREEISEFRFATAEEIASLGEAGEFLHYKSIRQIFEEETFHLDVEKSIRKKFHRDIFCSFTRAVRTYDLVQPNDRIAVCISGGKDSMLMAKLFQELKRHNQFPFELVFLVMDPGYNEQNRRLLEENARRLAIPITIVTSHIFDSVYHIDKNPCYLCARMRRGFLYAEAQKMGCNKIALGHHYDDVIDTILMGMLYGGQVQTMLPKVESAHFPGMQLIRPMYFIREERIKAWRDENHLTFLRCACRFTEECSQQEEENHSKRTEVKRLIAKLKETNPYVESNIFRSVENINLNTVMAYKKDGRKHYFWEEEEMEKRISGSTTLLALIGSPVSHSGSPAMYNYSFEKLGLDYAYVAFDVGEDRVKEAIDAVRLFHMRGINVTMPDKTAAAAYVDELSPAAQLIGAVNTVVNEDGRLIGHMTDGEGFVHNLRDHGIDIAGKKITVAGGGGAATAIEVQCALDGAREITILNKKDAFFARTLLTAEKIKSAVPDIVVNVYDIDDEERMTREIKESDIFANATIVGMKPMEDQSVVKDTSAFYPGLVVADAVYNPKQTRLLREAKEAGCTAIGGTGMLLWQGEAAFRLFTGQQMPLSDVKRLFFSEA